MKIYVLILGGNMSFIKFESVTKLYGNMQLGVIDLDFSIKQGEFVYIIGPSGCGKSTLLNLLMASYRPDEGNIIVGGRDILSFDKDQIPYYRRSYGIISFEVPLINYYDVYRNVALPLNIAHMNPKDIKSGVEIALGSVGIKHKMYSKIDELSGGEQLKVMIARAIVSNPAILIADEPTANLSPSDSWDIMNLLEHINHSGTTIIMATHSKKLVDITRKRVIKLERGRIISDRQKAYYDNNKKTSAFYF